MKKPFLTIFFIFYCLNSVYAISTVDELIEYCKKDPQKISKWISNNIRYKNDLDKWDKLEYFQSPSETLSKDNKYGLQSGDCEDYAILAYACLKKLGYKPLLLTMFNTKGAHCVCIFVYKGQWSYLGEEPLTKTNALFSLWVMNFYNKKEKTNYIGFYFLDEKKILLE
jgi:hypothetical protein